MEPSTERRDPTEGRSPNQQPLLQDAAPGPPLPLRTCLLSGGDSRRMGRDKALLPHPEGGTWLERSLRLLAQLEAPITLLSRHPAHLELAQGLITDRCGTANPENAVSITTLAEPPPWEGPLLALHRLMQHHPNKLLLLCPVDMPDLNLPVLHTLLAAAGAKRTTVLHLAHDGERLQPLLGLVPSSAPIRTHLAAAVERGERRLQGWLATQAIQTVPLDPHAIRNVNRPEDDQPIDAPSVSTSR